MLSDNLPAQNGPSYIIEENETIQRHAIVRGRGTKRRAGTEDTEDRQLSPTSREENSARPSKRRVVEEASRSSAETDSQVQGGAKLGEPDTDKSFLTALASMKKGKKNEDSFDREFNNLRISKPNIEREVIEQEWNLLDGLDDEHNMRGNFMLVLELEVYKKDREAGMGTSRTGRIDWEGKPNFKKFRKVCPLNLVVVWRMD
jgi:hypothetical protein